MSAFVLYCEGAALRQADTPSKESYQLSVFRLISKWEQARRPSPSEDEEKEEEEDVEEDEEEKEGNNPVSFWRDERNRRKACHDTKHFFLLCVWAYFTVLSVFQIIQHSKVG
jgi:hypothetical protein